MMRVKGLTGVRREMGCPKKEKEKDEKEEKERRRRYHDGGTTNIKGKTGLLSRWTMEG